MNALALIVLWHGALDATVQGKAAAARLEQLFLSWEKTQADVRSLVVEFTKHTKDLIYQQSEPVEGTFKLLRSPNGEFMASYEEVDSKTKQKKFCGLVRGGEIYLLMHEREEALKWRPADHDVRLFLQKRFNPLIVLLEKKRAQAECRLAIVKQDEWYTYLRVEPKKIRNSGRWPTELYSQGRVVLMRETTVDLPKHMPRQLWYEDVSHQYTFDIHRWRYNTDDGPKPEEFTRPEDRPGWQVADVTDAWLFR